MILSGHNEIGHSTGCLKRLLSHCFRDDTSTFEFWWRAILVHGCLSGEEPWGHGFTLKMRCDFAHIDRITGFDRFNLERNDGEDGSSGSVCA